jgi:glycosyltransferase involved in cell wall biosynthesis
MGDDGMTKAMFSVVIPTHNRAPILRRSLNHLLGLDGIADCEVIVINDGSTDGTAEVLEEARRVAPEIVRVITLTNGGPARARNHGVRAAKNDRIMFVDDDVFPRQGMLQHHWRLLDAGYTGSQGLLLWHEEIAASKLIQYIDSRGSQFAFDQVKDPERLEFPHVYTGNFAVLRSAVLEAGGFDERFFNDRLKFGAFEDTILGYRLQQDGAKLALNLEAIADHLHDMTEEHYFQREYKVGYNIGHLTERYPAIARSLGVDRKDFLVEPQLELLKRLNTSPMIGSALGYSLKMRLRHREAFYRGYLLFKRERAQSGMGPQQ